MSETEDSSKMMTRKRDRSLYKRMRVAERTVSEGEGSELEPAVVNSHSVVGPISSTSSGLQPFQSHDYLRSPRDVPLIVVSKCRPHKACSG